MELQESLNEFYGNIEEGYYSFCDYLEKNLKIPVYEAVINPIEDKGIPSLPVVFTVLLLILAGGIFLLYNSAPNSLKITVFDENEVALSDASIELVAAGNILAAKTNADGTAQFEKLPKNIDAQIKVTKGGFEEKKRDFKIGRGSNSLKIILTQQKEQEFDIAILSFEGSGLNGAEIKYSYSLNGEIISNSVYSDSSGNAKIQAKENTEVTLAISLSGYDGKTLTYAPKKGEVKKITLRIIPIIIPSSENPVFEILVKDDSDGSAVDADLEIYDSLTNDLLKEATTKFGSYQTSDFKVGTALKVKAVADGYAPLSRTKTLVEGKNNLPLRLIKNAGTTNANETFAKIKVIDESKNPLISEIRLWEIELENSTIVETELAESELKASVSRAKGYYATAFREGYLPGKTLKFIGPSEKTISLQKATANNSINLTILALDEDNRKLAATIAFFDSDDYQMPPYDLRTVASTGKLLIKNFPKGIFKIVASKDNFNGFSQVDLQDPAEFANVTLFAPRGEIKISAMNFDNQTISEFSAFAFYQNEKNNSKFASCNPENGVCTLTLRSDKQFKIVVSSPNYEDASISNWRAPANGIREETVTLARLGNSDVSRIRYDKITALNFNPATSLVSDTSYLLFFDIYAKDSVETNSLYLQLLGSDGSEIAHVENYSVDGNFPSKVIGNTQFASSASCTVNFDSAKDAFKPLNWLNAEYSFRGSSKVAFRFKIDPRINADGLVVKFRSLALSRGEVFRDPIDSVLGLALEKDGVPWCKVATKNQTISVSACGNFGEVCCTTRKNTDLTIDSCNAGMRCEKSESQSRGVCTSPTSCGSPNYFCSDNTVCCQGLGGKSCVNSNSCSLANIRECTPTCNIETQFCNSQTDTSAGTCSSITSICGLQSQQCCPGANKCTTGLTCGTNNLCAPCGGVGQECCPYSDSNPNTACTQNLQCVKTVAKSTCQNPEICGSTNSKCVGATVCCKDSDALGVCVPYSECSNQLKCSNCKFDQFCDATNLNVVPICKDCISSPSACAFGKPGQLCSNTDPTKYCQGGACTPQVNSSYGICSACGLVGQKCCDLDPYCTVSDTICSSSTKTCIIGNQDCNNEACVSLEFEQQQNCVSGTSLLCDTVKSGNGFIAKSIKSCGSDCKDGKLKIKYAINEVARKYPGTLTINISNILSIVPESLYVQSANRRTLLSANSNIITIQIPDASWLRGEIIAIPSDPSGKVVVSASYSHASSIPPISVRPYLTVQVGTIAPPTKLPNLFSCNSLEIKTVIYNGTTRPVIETSCDKIVFQVDSIFPQDAIPLIAPENLYQFHFGTLANPNLYDSCFDTSDSNGGKAIRYWPIKSANCPLAPIGNSIPSAEFVMNITLLNSGNSQSKTINISITNYTLSSNVKALDFSVINYKSFDSIPKSYYKFNDESYSPIRLVYSLNNRFLASTMNQPDTYYAATYVPQSTYFVMEPTKALILDKSKTASLFSWNSDSKNSIAFYPKTNQSVVAVPTKVFEINSKDPSQASLTEKLISSAYSASSVNLQGLEDAKKECLSAAVADANLAKSNCASPQTDVCISTYENDIEYIQRDYDDGLSDCLQDYSYCKNQCTQSNSQCLNSCSQQNSSCVANQNSIYNSAIAPYAQNRDQCLAKAENNCQYAYDKEYASKSLECGQLYSKDYDYNFAKAIISEFKKLAIDTAMKTAFKRSFENTLYCTKSQPTQEETANPQICRGSADAWLVVKKLTSKTKLSCEFCYDQYAGTYGVPTPENDNVDVCDIRCQPDPQKTCGSDYCAFIDAGENFTDSNGILNTCQDTGTDAVCPYVCQTKSQKQGDFCGDPSRCNCDPDGTYGADSVLGYEFNWENTSNLVEVKISTGILSLSNSDPLKYFVQSSATKPFKFSAVVPLNGNQVFNILTSSAFTLSSGDRVDVSEVLSEEKCSVRQGVFLLETQTTNGVDLYSGTIDSGYFAKLKPLTIDENYPNEQGSGQDYCGSVVACNLFDPTKILSSKGDYVKNNLFSSAKYPASCLTFEWPIVPDLLFNLNYFETADKAKSGTGGFYQPDATQYSNLLQASTYYYIKGTWTRNSFLWKNLFSLAYSRWTSGKITPYKIAKYPDVFSP
ncbi:hypothetical protein HY989_01780 [Candidatus Micrarchaeota archaeon]|nr:hypothetical protein [Candidatus Micrarchaeota archaeon]